MLAHREKDVMSLVGSMPPTEIVRPCSSEQLGCKMLRVDISTVQNDWISSLYVLTKLFNVVHFD